MDLPSTVLYALAAPSTPEPVREQAIERAKAGETITAEQVREMERGAQPPLVIVPSASAAATKRRASSR